MDTSKDADGSSDGTVVVSVGGIVSTVSPPNISDIFSVSFWYSSESSSFSNSSSSKSGVVWSVASVVLTSVVLTVSMSIRESASLSIKSVTCSIDADWLTRVNSSFADFNTVARVALSRLSR
mgnify:CR=1 FL=1